MSVRVLEKEWQPKTSLGRMIQDCLPYIPEYMRGELIDKVSSVVVAESSLSAVVYRANGAVEDLGVICTKVVTDTGVGFIVDAFQNLVELENMKYHGVGTGTTAEAASQTALVTESTTALNPDNTRATGTLTEGAANVFITVGLVSFDAGAVITEHALFSQSATGGGVMFDRSVFAAINVGVGDSIQFTYNLTFTSGG